MREERSRLPILGLNSVGQVITLAWRALQSSSPELLGGLTPSLAVTWWWWWSGAAHVPADREEQAVPRGGPAAREHGQHLLRAEEVPERHQDVPHGPRPGAQHLQGGRDRQTGHQPRAAELCNGSVLCRPLLSAGGSDEGVVRAVGDGRSCGSFGSRSSATSGSRSCGWDSSRTPYRRSRQSWEVRTRPSPQPTHRPPGRQCTIAAWMEPHLFLSVCDWAPPLLSLVLPPPKATPTSRRAST